MRIIATLAVVFLHTNNTLSNNSAQFSLTEKQMLFFTTNNHLMNWAVPVFLMITGALLLYPDRNITYTICIKKYIKRIFLALVVFGIPFSLMEILLNTGNLNLKSVWDAFVSVLCGNSWSHLWYLYSLIGLYMMLPILKTFMDNSDDDTQRYVLVVVFFFCFVIKWINKFCGVTVAFEIPISGFTVFYALTGRYITKIKPHFLIKKRICAGVLALEIVTIVISSKGLYPEIKEFMGYDSPLIAIFAITIFMLFSGFTSRLESVLWEIDRLCFGVYLIHPVFINFVYKFLKVTPVEFDSAYPMVTIVFWIFFVVSSFVTAWGMYQIPILKKYIL